MSRPLNDLEKSIIQALKDGSLTTSEIAEEVSEEPRTVYNFCKHLEKREGLLTSKIEKRGRRAFYFPTTKQILTRDNYETIMNEIENADNPEVPGGGEADSRLCNSIGESSRQDPGIGNRNR